MDNLLLNNYTNLYSVITYYGIIFVAFIHLLGYRDLRKWLVFSGIGAEAKRVEDNYGYLGLMLLNGLALIMFLLMAVIYNLRTNNQIYLYVTYGIILAFILRGLGGYLFILTGKIGTATPFWEFIFSTFALGIGISGILEFGGN